MCPAEFVELARTEDYKRAGRVWEKPVIILDCGGFSTAERFCGVELLVVYSSSENSPLGDGDKMSLRYTLRRYRDGDEQAIFELLNTTFGGWHSLEYWRWWYRNNPDGSSIIWLAEQDGKIIGHYGMIPRTMKVGNAYVAGSFACDAATHPDYQGKGVFSSIVNKACLDATENHIAIGYGFADTSGRIYKRYERMGHICSMVRMIKVLEWEQPLERYVGKPLARGTAAAIRKIGAFRNSIGKMSRSTYPTGLTIEKIRRFDEKIDTFWDEISPNFKIIARRDHRYLNWRYASHPEKKYTIYKAVKEGAILGYCVLAREHWQNLEIGVIMDILGYHDVVSCLIDEAVQRFQQENVNAIAIMMSEQHPYRCLFRRSGFITYARVKWALYATINLRGSAIEEKEIYPQALLLSQNPLLKKKSNWFMIEGDGDAAWQKPQR